MIELTERASTRVEAAPVTSSHSVLVFTWRGAEPQQLQITAIQFGMASVGGSVCTFTLPQTATRQA